ncbi:MAG: HEPN domain-containing protein [Proteobacteria bacterium]|nr:HEPN domain-containing protein [Pseudomonadota bacterium]NOG58977.1 HEPN domain-containing protein [Pseudomonadota bacterium]
MSLNKLAGKTLENIEPDSTTIIRLLNAAERNIQDAHINKVSDENRFDAAYKSIMQSANAALQANGYRTLSSKPGHHMTLIQSLSKTIELDADTIIILDTLRKQRNATDYSGHTVPESAMKECLSCAENLLHDVRHWIEKNNPDLL